MGPLYRRIAAALLWLAAFAYATGVFFSITLLFRSLPPTAPVAIGIVPIEQYSKLRDYLGAALFMFLVPPLTVWFERIGGRLLARERERFRHRVNTRDMVVTALFTIPFVLSPVFYLTTGKAGWILFLPVAIAYGAVRGLHYRDSARWLRELGAAPLGPYHALIFCEALSWILYRYLVTGRRIAHISTLFLETVFVALFLALFWAVVVLMARLAQIHFGKDLARTFGRVATAGLPLVLLPLVPLFLSPTRRPAVYLIVALLLSALLAIRAKPLPPVRARRLAAYLIIPGLIYCVSYAATAHHSQWVDLFHRGEAIGPASDYLRGKAPYRDVFVLHGLLEDGLLDAWLMEIFGRTLDVAVARTVVIGAFLSVSLWFLGLAVFQSIPLALLVVAIGSWTTAENNRTFFQVAAVALLWIGMRRRPSAAFVSGVFAGVALFFSYEIGLYTIAGAVASAAVVALMSRFSTWDGVPPLRVLGLFLAGSLAGGAPFIVYLASRGTLGDFVHLSFVVIPGIIDAVWSLPFPDLVSPFRRDLTLHTLADFVLREKFHLILSPLTIAISAVYLIRQTLRRRLGTIDFALAVLTVFAAIAQRTAFGRAEFRHQYFAAFLIGPMLVVLTILFVRSLRANWREEGEGHRAFVVAVGAAAIPLAVVLFWIPDLINARIDDFINYQRRVLRVLHDPHAEEVNFRIDAVSQAIRRLTRAGEPIFDFSNQPAFYFFADRPNPTRFYQVPIASPARYQAEVIQTLERTKPKVVIRTSPENYDEIDGVSNALRAQAVAAYIDDTYRFYRSIRGVEIWTRIPAARPAELATYLRRIQLPAKNEVVRAFRERMVFPVVGSTAGANGAFWVSELTLHNPFRDPISLSLRFIGGETHIDRRITLAPRQTMRWPDVVRTLFASDGIGTLWIQHRQERAPVAVVKTADVARGGRHSVETPLTRRHAVTAGSDTPELTIVGIPAPRPPWRRVNVGVVNVGIIAATFRIVATTRTGAMVGKPMEAGVPEDEVWLVNDIEREMGVQLDDTMTIRITAIAGTGVAFATVVESTGDTEFLAATPAQQ
ncbi:MAG: hypothetical protein ABIO78_08375 [Thermoanaerobaculia bacterium]